MLMSGQSDNTPFAEGYENKQKSSGENQPINCLTETRQRLPALLDVKSGNRDSNNSLLKVVIQEIQWQCY